jgi:hypothetical protein
MSPTLCDANDYLNLELKTKNSKIQIESKN